jgi:SAM-dependent methyltransferase
MTNEQWTWDESLFAGSAPYYVRGRLPYARGVPEALATALALDGRGRLIDVGCGPGIVVLLLAHLLEQVVGIDPDAGMLEEAARRAAEQQATNVRWVRMRAEDLPAGLGTFRVATFSRSFHWMDRDRVAALIRDMLEQRGAFVLVSERHAVVEGGRPAPDEEEAAPLPHPTPPFDELNALVRRYLGPERRAGQSVRTTSPGDEEAVLARVGFEAPESIWVTGGEIVERNADDVLAHYYSRSSSAPHLFGDRLAQFDAEARAILAAAAADGRFAERVPDTELRIWRTAPGSGTGP